MNEIVMRLANHVDKHQQLILDVERHIWNNPELGYKEWKTTRYLEAQFEALGYTLTRAGDIPGFIADLDTGRPGPKIAILAELDSLICGDHPECDPETKAVHACGHNAQSAYLVGCAAAMAMPGAMDGLCGSVRFVSVPAEETIDLEYRSGLIKAGKIHYVAGKIEFLYRGLLDDVDIALFTHVSTEKKGLFEINEGSDGCLTKHFEYLGVAAHAGAYPHEGVNALYAATLGMQACNALRETFPDDDHIRFHPIITEGGVAANAIPGVVKMETYVRASTLAKMLEVNQRINRALCASAAAIGADLLIQDIPGNMPLHNDEGLNAVCAESITEIFGEGVIEYTPWTCGATDMGDLSCLMPAIHPHATGGAGNAHGMDYQVADPVRACVNTAKMLSGMVAILLSDGAKRAGEVLSNYKPVFESKDAYFAAIDAIKMEKRTVHYNEDGTVLLDFTNNTRGGTKQ